MRVIIKLNFYFEVIGIKMYKSQKMAINKLFFTLRINRYLLSLVIVNFKT